MQRCMVLCFCVAVVYKSSRTVDPAIYCYICPHRDLLHPAKRKGCSITPPCLGVPVIIRLRFATGLCKIVIRCWPTEALDTAVTRCSVRSPIHAAKAPLLARCSCHIRHKAAQALINAAAVQLEVAQAVRAAGGGRRSSRSTCIAARLYRRSTRQARARLAACTVGLAGYTRCTCINVHRVCRTLGTHIGASIGRIPARRQVACCIACGWCSARHTGHAARHSTRLLGKPGTRGASLHKLLAMALSAADACSHVEL
jgi:hypothetical protein